MVVPPIVAEIVALPEELHSFYMYLRQLMGPFAQGPVALIARHDDECVFSADALGPAPAVAARVRPTTSSSAPSPASSRSSGWSPSRSRWPPARSSWSRSTASKRALDAVPARGDAARGPEALARAHRGRGDGRLQGRSSRPAARSRAARSPATPPPGPSDPVEVARPRPRRLRLAARRRQARPADGLERRRADRLARLRRPAGRALARAPEPGRLLQGDGRGRHQPGDRPRARDRALLDPRDLRPPPD